MVEARTKEIITLWNEEEFEALKTESIEEMETFFQKEEAEEIKKMIHSDWGAFQALGNVYMVQIRNGFRQSAFAEVSVAYENVNVTYSLFFNKDMELEGFWIR